MLHSSKTRLISPKRAVEEVRRELARLGRPSKSFDAARYFRGSGDLGFYNVGTGPMRDLAKRVYSAHRDDWSIDDAVDFADTLIKDRFLEAKSVGIEVLAFYRVAFTTRLFERWKCWLADGHSSNWATTDAICGRLIGPLVLAHPQLVSRLVRWTRHRNMWVRRAAAVGLIPTVRKGAALDAAYAIALTLHPDREDLIQKAVGWLLREAGKTDAARLEQYLRAEGPTIPRTTVRYAIERYGPRKRRALLAVTYGR